MKRFIVITTIHAKSAAIVEFEKQDDWHIVVVGDRKSQPMASSENFTYLSVARQLELDYGFAGQCPFNHYARKNIGYLYALQQGAEIIYDTDDDNTPYPGWKLPGFSCADKLVSDYKFINIYNHFTGENIWPRGFPLDEIQPQRQRAFTVQKGESVDIGAWQGLTDGEPDTDAIYWLVINKKLKFAQKEAVYLPQGQFCPINSQNTSWRKETFPYLYLPAAAGFRFTDILRGYIAQRLMWQQELHIGFLAATVFQERNPHHYVTDFKDEFDSYVNIKRYVEILEKLDVCSDPCENMRRAYEALCRSALVKEEELTYLNLWLEDYSKLK